MHFLKVGKGGGLEGTTNALHKKKIRKLLTEIYICALFASQIVNLC